MTSRDVSGLQASDFGWPCPTGPQMAEIDRDAIEKRGVPARVLMENAGRAIAQAIRQRYPAARRPLVICGSGNNGGDGFVVARVLRDSVAQCEPRVACFGNVDHYSPETAANRALIVQQGIPCVHAPEASQLQALVARADLVVDALFGVGLSRPIEGALAEAIGVLRQSGLPCVAVDVPSGVCATSGSTLGVALRADLTVTLGLPKLGLVTRAPDGGALWVADIGFPRAAYAAVDVFAALLSESAVAALLPERAHDAHKGSFGHCLVVAGARGKTGAAVLSARGALRGGAGLVTLAVPETQQSVVAPQLPEAMTLALADAGTGALEAAAADAVLEALDSRDVLVIGPGIGTGDGARSAVQRILAEATCPAVVDADALNLVAGELEALRSPAPRLLTPHPGEAARMLACGVPEVQSDRVGAVRELATRSGAYVVLKGARSLVHAPGGPLLVNPTGGPGLSAGGSGDVLSGLIGALLAQGLPPLAAAASAVYLHGRAGEGREVGWLAREIADAVPLVWQQLRAARECAHDTGPLVPLL